MVGIRENFIVNHARAGAALALAGLLLSAPVLADGPGDGVAAAPREARQSGENASQALVRLNAARARATGTERDRLTDELRAAAMARHDMLEGMIKEFPAEVLRLALPAGEAADMPAEAQPWIEQAVEIEGELEVLHVDFADGTDEYRYFLRTDLGERFSLHFAEVPRGGKSGEAVRASGLLFEGMSAEAEDEADGAMVLASEAEGVEVLAAGDEEVAAAPSSGLSNTFGQQNTVILLVNFQNNPSNQPFTPATIDSMAGGQLSNFFRENSSQQTWLNVDTYGWYTIAQDSTSCSYNTISSLADSAATNAGVNLSGYSRKIYVFPNTSACGWGGLGTIGGNPSRSWINGYSGFGIYAHELGHNFGVYHSHALDCGVATLCSGGTNIEYGHYGDTMGSGVYGHFNAFQKERLGWLAYNASPTVTTAQSSGVYTIKPYSAADGGPKALKVLKSTDGNGRKTYYYIESRRAIGFDAPLSGISGSNFLGGVTFHIGTEASPDSSFMLDMTPANSSFADGALAVNQGYADSAAGVTITPLSVSDSEARIDVDFGGVVACVRANPTVTVTPGESQWVPAGTAVTFNVAVVNNDGGACASSSFTMSATAPSGWTASHGASSLSLAPGASGSTSLQVTSPGSAADGYHDVTSRATNAGATGFTGADTATYVVSNGPQNQAPVAVNDSGKTSAGSSVTINALVNDSDPDGDAIAIAAVSQGAKGTVAIVGGQIVYTAGTQFRGSDSFSYSISDGEDTASATVTVQALKRGQKTQRQRISRLTSR
jgi:hypothetical protein